MSDRDIKRIFEETDKQIGINGQKRCESVAFLMKAADDQKKYAGIETKKVIRNQLPYMDKSMLWIQLFVGFLVMLFFIKLGNLETPKENIMAYAMILSGMMGVLVPGGIHRSFTSRMVELSETCYFNTKQMVVFQMVYAGIFSLVWLAAGIVFVGSKWQVSLVQIGFYMLVPFVFSNCCCLGALLTETGRKSAYTFVVVGLLVSFSYVILASNSYVYQTSALIFWGIALGAGILLFVIQLYVLFRYIEKGEILCMN